ncbi:MAG TPA: TonB-dependent receptor [Lentimicrobium sp.]|nr:TonB-dependent receptor [Lentimicrobium sp.]
MLLINKQTFVLFLLMFLISGNIVAQTITGTVKAKDSKGKAEGLPGVNIHWLGTTIGAITDTHGKFNITRKDIPTNQLVVSFLGYKTDTITVKNTPVDITMVESASELSGVEVKQRVGTSFISQLNPHKVQVITSNELKRAACCNLSESFETNSSVDVSYADAISGAKQIQLLGLSGIYSQVISENVPLLRGLGATFGLGYIPGPWMESISVSKGASSVMNGFESTTGLINVEYKKPAQSEKLFLNGFVNHNGRVEMNFNSGVELNEKLSTMVLGHVSTFQTPFDRNNDQFMDIPKITTYNFINRWDYDVPGKFDSRLLVKYMDETREGGYMNFDDKSYNPQVDKISNLTETYGFHLSTKRLESFWKNGFILNDHRSIALIVSGIYHSQDGFFGMNKYDGKQKSMYSNLIYQDIIGGNPNHRITTGLSFIYDNYDEDYQRRDFTFLYQSLGVTDVTAPLDTLLTVDSYRDTVYVMDREEIIPGAYLEYSWTAAENLNLIGGIRIDHHNKYGTFYTPRFHLRYKVFPNTAIRASAGKGYRSANLFAENFSVMASQRVIHIQDDIKQEEAWNYGINITHDFKLFERDAQVDFEAYRTDFLSQVIADLDSIPSDVFFYNLDGKSFANSYMAQITFEPVKQLQVLAAFRISDVKYTINGLLREKPMVSSYKGIISLNYATRFEKWKYDLTSQFIGKARIPDTKKMPAALQREDYAPAFIQLSAQVTRKFKHFELYLGGENLTNFTQKDPITEAFAPYHTHFDTSMVWGPLVGATVYAGFRYSIPHE